MSKPPDLLLNTKTVAALIGRSVYTLQRARHDRADLQAPPHVRIGTRGVGYPLHALLGWAQAHGRTLDWTGVPLRYALPAAERYRATGAAVPAELQALRGRVVAG